MALQIQGVRSKKILIEIYHVVQEDSPEVSENSNGMFMFFESLKDETYVKLQKIIDNHNKTIKSASTTDSSTSEQKSYRPYFHDEFPSEREMNHKLRYNNKEKSLIKRKQYDKEINENEEVEYCEFDVSMTTESETKIKPRTKSAKKYARKPKKRAE